MAIVLVAAALSTLPGLERRSLTGDELGSLGHSVPHMLERSVNIDQPDDWSAHLPLAWSLRHGFHRLFGPQRIVVWRLHSVLGVWLAALVSWWLVRRRGTPWRAVAVGLLVALHPLLSFHARDSTNYSLSALTGAVLLAGLADVGRSRRSAGWLLALGLLLGASNDLFFAFPAFAALLLTPWLVRGAPDRGRSRRAAWTAWLVTVGVLAVPAVLVAIRGRSTTLSLMFERHTNPDEMSSAAATLGELLEFCSAFLGGYRVAGDTTFGVAGLAMVVGCVVFALASRDAHARAAAGLVVLGIAGVLLADWGFGQVLWDDRANGLSYRGFPSQPRTYLALLPALALVWVDGLAACGRRLGPVLVCALLYVAAAATAQDVAAVQDGQAWATETIEEHWEPGDFVVTLLRLDMRLPASMPSTTDSCVPGDRPSPHRVWMVSFAGGPDPAGVRFCGDGAGRLVDAGYRLRLSEYRFLPGHDRATNSFLPFATWLFALERSEPPTPPIQGRPWRLRFEPSWLSGVTTVNVNQKDHPFAPEVVLGATTGQLEELSVTLLPRSGGPLGWPLIRRLTAPARGHAAIYPAMVVPADPLEPTLTLRVPSFRTPWLEAPRWLAVGLLGCVGGGLPLFLLIRRRRAARPRSGGASRGAGSRRACARLTRWCSRRRF